ncbi:Coatomer subunit beta, partial [Dictyocoela roeselum]
RRNAIYGLAMVHKRYPETVDRIYEAMIRGLEKQAFASMLVIDRRRAMDILGCDVELMKPDLLELVVPLADLGFLEKCSHFGKCTFDTNLAILRKRCAPQLKEMAIEKILEEIRIRPQLRTSALKEMQKCCIRELKGHGLEILSIGQTKEQFEVCAALAVQVAATHEKKAIQDFLIQKFAIEQFRVVVIRSLAEICDQESNVVSILDMAIVDKNPEVVYETAVLLSKKNFKRGPEILLKGLSTKYARIFKFILSVLADKLEDPKLLINFALEYAEEKRDNFFGQDVAMALSKIPGYDKEKKMAIEKLKFHFENILKTMGKGADKSVARGGSDWDKLVASAICAEAMENIFDLCLEKGNSNFENLLPPVQKSDFIGLPDFSSIRFEGPPKYGKSEYSKVKVVPLTGIGDPIFCEARVKIDGLAIYVETLFANQTNSTLHNVSADFSAPIEQKTFLPPLTLLPRTLKAQHYSFEMTEPATCFITGTISFNYVQEEGVDLQSMIINMSEIKFRVSD